MAENTTYTESAEERKRRLSDKAEELKLAKEQLKIEQAIAEKLNDKNRLSVANLDTIKVELEALRKENDLRAINEETTETILKKVEELKDKYGDILQEYGSSAEILANIDSVYAKINKRASDLDGYVKKSDDHWNSIAGHMGMGRNFVDGFAKSATEMAEKMKSNKDYAMAMKNSFHKTFNLSRAMTSVFLAIAQSTAKIAMQADQIASAFATATGFGNKYREEIINAGQSHRDLGIGIKQSGEAFQTLLLGTANFVNLSQKARKTITMQSAGLSRLGVDLATQTEMINYFNLALGMNAQESMNATQRISMMGAELGISASKMSKDFSASMKTLAVYGKNSITVFEGLSTAAKSAGVEVGSLLALADKFDTFAGAAETTAKLNALLGTQLSASNMLLATEDKRLETLINTVQANGVAFKDMDRFQKKAVAAAAGITDMNEAQKIFEMNMGQYKAHRKEMEDTEASQRRIEEAIKATIPLQEMLTIAFSELAVALTPVLEKLRWFMGHVVKILEVTPEWVKTLIAITGGLFAMKTVLMPLVGLLGAFAGAATVAAPAAAPLSIAIAEIGAAIAAAAPGIAVLVIALGALGAAYALITSQKARMVEAEAAESEAFSRTIQGLQNLGSATSDLQAIRTELSSFGDIDINARATLTNLALISAGRAAEQGTARIIESREVVIDNQLENVLNNQVVVNLDRNALTSLLQEGHWANNDEH